MYSAQILGVRDQLRHVMCGMCASMSTCGVCMCARMCLYVRTCVHEYGMYIHVCISVVCGMCTCVCVCVHAWTDIFISPLLLLLSCLILGVEFSFLIMRKSTEFTNCSKSVSPP